MTEVHPGHGSGSRLASVPQCGPSPMRHLFRGALHSHPQSVHPLADFRGNIVRTGPNFIRDMVRSLAATPRQALSLVPKPLRGALLRFERQETASDTADPAAHC